MPVELSPACLNEGLEMSWCRHSGGGIGSSEHYHASYEFFLFLGESMRYFVKDRSYKVGKNNLVFISGNTFHHSEYPGAGGNERLLVCFDDTLFRLAGGEFAKARIEKLFRSRAAALPPEIGARVASDLLQDIYPEYRQHGIHEEVGRLRAMLRMTDLLLELSELEDRKILIDIEPMETSRAGSRVPDMVRYINENYTERISLGDMSAALYLDKFYMCHVFKKSTGLSIIEFTTRKRLSEAERRVQSSTEPLTAIAASVGFNSANHFTELFKALYGMPPSEYRRMYLAKT